MTDPIRKATQIDLSALEAIVWAVARSQARQSRSSLLDLLDALSERAEHVRYHSASDQAQCDSITAIIDAWMEDLKAEGCSRQQTLNADHLRQ